MASLGPSAWNSIEYLILTPIIDYTIEFVSIRTPQLFKRSVVATLPSVHGANLTNCPAMLCSVGQSSVTRANILDLGVAHL